MSPSDSSNTLVPFNGAVLMGLRFDIYISFLRLVWVWPSQDRCNDPHYIYIGSLCTLALPIAVSVTFILNSVGAGWDSNPLLSRSVYSLLVISKQQHHKTFEFGGSDYRPRHYQWRALLIWATQLEVDSPPPSRTGRFIASWVLSHVSLVTINVQTPQINDHWWL